MIRVRVATVGFGSLLLAALLGSLVAPAPVLAATGPTTPIKHLVVMTQDQHSFDNYFGARAGVDGIPAGICLPIHPGSATPCVEPSPRKATESRPSLDASALAESVAYDKGRMDGFVQAQTTIVKDGAVAMGYYPPDQLPILTDLANGGVLFDHWFAALPGGSISNRLFAVSAVATPDTAEVPASGWPDMTLIFDRLQAAGVSWRIYVENYAPSLTASTADASARRSGQVARVPMLAMSRYENSSALMSHIVNLSQYYADLHDGTLPAVSWIVTTASTERSPRDPRVGQRVVSSTVNALIGSSAWPSSAFLLTYDSSGGWYDHVVPPTVDGTLLGLRVPGILISPYAVPGSVNHEQMDSASVLRFIETNWSVPALNGRDAAATNLASAFHFDQPPRAATLLTAADPSPPITQPNRAILYSAYILLAAAALSIVGWAWRGSRENADGRGALS